MKIEDLAKLPKGSFLTVDPTQIRMEPLSWDNFIHFYFGSSHKQVRRYTAFNAGLCDGVAGSFPPTFERGGVRQGCGRKHIAPEEKKVPITVWPKRATVELLGGKERVRKMLMNCLNQKI
jgi:hypothetical protein